MEAGMWMENDFEYAVFDPVRIPRREISDSDSLVKDPLVSALVITYNHAPYVAQAIESVVRQETSFSFELIIGEDCSTDATREIVLKYQRAHPKIIRVITADRNVGAKRNFWRIYEACRGKYVALCEGDDYWHSALKLEKQVDFMEKHPSCGLVHCDCDVLVVAQGGRRIQSHNRLTKRTPRENGDLYGSILAGTYRIRTPAVCMRKQLLDRVFEDDPVLFRSNRFYMTDTAIWLELSRLSKFKYLDESLATYRVLPESASQSQDLQRVIRFEKRCYELMEYFLHKYPCQKTTREQVIRNWYRRQIDLAFKACDVDLANEAVEQLNKESIRIGAREMLKRWATRRGPLNTLARGLQSYTRPLRSRNRHFSRY
jgi:glycosyltransferase involved in cell wall biosynthesis